MPFTTSDSRNFLYSMNENIKSNKSDKCRLFLHGESPAGQEETLAVKVNDLSCGAVLVSGHQDVLLQSKVSGPGPRHVEHVLLPLQALPGDPIDQEDPGAPAGGVESVPGRVDQDLGPVVARVRGQRQSLGLSQVAVRLDPAEK